jgi:hypothetical protein
MGNDLVKRTNLELVQQKQQVQGAANSKDVQHVLRETAKDIAAEQMMRLKAQVAQEEITGLVQHGQQQMKELEKSTLETLASLTGNGNGHGDMFAEGVNDLAKEGVQGVVGVTHFGIANVARIANKAVDTEREKKWWEK